MARDDLNVLSAFLAVAEERSFTKAAKRLGVSQSALSHAIRALEEEVGIRLLTRTTRSVAPTDAGDDLLRSVRPALTDIRAALGKISWVLPLLPESAAATRGAVGADRHPSPKTARGDAFWIFQRSAAGARHPTPRPQTNASIRLASSRGRSISTS